MHNLKLYIDDMERIVPCDRLLRDTCGNEFSVVLFVWRIDYAPPLGKFGESGGDSENHHSSFSCLEIHVRHSEEYCIEPQSSESSLIMTEKTIDVKGIEFYTLYEQPPNEPKDAPLVLLSHALMANHRMWDATVSALTQGGYRTLRYDHIGHNKTPVPESYSPTEPAYHFDDFTHHMRELVREVTGSTKVHTIIGCSMGGVLALRYAMLYPSDVENVISCDAPGLTSLEEAKPLWSQRLELFEQDVKSGQDTLCHKTVERWLPGSDPQTLEMRAAALQQVKTCSLDGYKICADAIRDFDYLEQLDAVRAKSMVLVGSEDSAVGPKSVLEDVASRIKDCEYVMVQGAGHLPPMHRPDEFNTIMLGFLGKQ